MLPESLGLTAVIVVVALLANGLYALWTMWDD